MTPVMGEGSLWASYDGFSIDFLVGMESHREQKRFCPEKAATNRTSQGRGGSRDNFLSVFQWARGSCTLGFYILASEQARLASSSQCPGHRVREMLPLILQHSEELGGNVASALDF